jgi:hypothetical protein
MVISEIADVGRFLTGRMVSSTTDSIEDCADVCMGGCGVAEEDAEGVRLREALVGRPSSFAFFLLLLDD